MSLLLPQIKETILKNCLDFFHGYISHFPRLLFLFRNNWSTQHWSGHLIAFLNQKSLSLEMIKLFFHFINWHVFSNKSVSEQISDFFNLRKCNFSSFLSFLWMAFICSLRNPFFGFFPLLNFREVSHGIISKNEFWLQTIFSCGSSSILYWYNVAP